MIIPKAKNVLVDRYKIDIIMKETSAVEQRNRSEQSSGETEEKEIMNQFELFCMVYYVLDAEWDRSKDAQLGVFLSSANPFLFADIGSADPSVYARFCEIAVEPITIENSYHIASAYIQSLGNDVISSSFSTIDEKEWIECVKEYLVQDHKGSSI